MERTLDDFAGSPVTGLRIRQNDDAPRETGYTYLILRELQHARPLCRRRILNNLVDVLGRALHGSYAILITFEGGGEFVESFNPSIAADP